MIPLRIAILVAVFMIGALMPWRCRVADSAEPETLPVLAPGVLTTVPAVPEEEETASPPITLREITTLVKPWQPNYSSASETLHALSQDVILRRPVWQLEFSYKPLRMISLGTATDGTNAPRTIWYMVYRINNVGRYPVPVPTKDDFGHDQMRLREANMPLRFFPAFQLRDQETGMEWLDQVVPEALARIHAIEIRDPKVPLYDAVRISSVELAPSSEETDRGVWGVAMWEGVDRRADFISVFVQGLTNAYRWNPDATGAEQLTFKTLQVNFWRPGDAIDEHVGEFRRGLPSFTQSALQRVLRIYQLDLPRDFNWKFRP